MSSGSVGGKAFHRIVFRSDDGKYYSAVHPQLFKIHFNTVINVLARILLAWVQLERCCYRNCWNFIWNDHFCKRQSSSSQSMVFKADHLLKSRNFLFLLIKLFSGVCSCDAYLCENTDVALCTYECTRYFSLPLDFFSFCSLLQLLCILMVICVTAGCFNLVLVFGTRFLSVSWVTVNVNCDVDVWLQAAVIWCFSLPQDFSLLSDILILLPLLKVSS